MKTKTRKLLTIAVVVVLMTTLCSINAFAAGDVAQAIESTWTSARGQIKTIVNNVVFPVIDVILAILLFVKIGTMYLDCAPVKANY